MGLARGVKPCLRKTSKASCCVRTITLQARVKSVSHIDIASVYDGRPAEDVGDDLDLGRLSASRDTDRLRFGPPLPPWAERCALM
jgi:hypothetical protein